MSNFISSEWPVTYKKDLYINNSNANIAIVTYWSNIDYVKKLITDMTNINVIGNAYSKILCLNPILVNLSTNRYIRYLILCGDDKENAEHTFDNFFNGNLIESMDSEYIDALTHIKRQITIHKTNFDKINDTIKSLSTLPAYDHDIIDISSLLKPKSSIVWNSNDSGYICRSNDLTELFFRINQKLMTRGKLSKIRDLAIREINNLVTVYNGPILDKLDDCFMIDPQRIQDYYYEFSTRIKPNDQAYTYATRMSIDEIQRELTMDKFTKRAYTPIFYETDYQLSTNPCAVGVHYLVCNDKLHATIFFRSNDMFRAWPLNMLGFRYQQQLIAKNLGYGLGPTTIISSSAHIYSENWTNANDLIARIKYISNKFFDPEGYFICSKEEDDTILVNYHGIDGKIQWMWQKPTNEHEELLYEITSHLTDTQHAAYVAKEIIKLTYNIYTENSANKMLKDIPQCTSDSCSK